MKTYKTEELLSNLFNICPSYTAPLSDQALNEWRLSQEKIPSLCGKGNPFFGQRHTRESKEMMSAAAKNRPSNRKGVALSKTTKSLISKNSARKKGVKTHRGTFASKAEAAKILNTTTNSLRVILNEKMDVPVTRASPIFDKEHVGKTPRELGWSYV